MGVKTYLVLQYDSDLPNVPTFVPLTADIVAGIVRPMRETTLAADTLSATDGGIIAKNSPCVITLSAYSAAQDGNQYGLKNASSGDITIATAPGEFIQTASGNVTTLTLNPDYAWTIIRNATITANWIIQ